MSKTNVTLRSFLTFAMILSAGVSTLCAADSDAPLADAVKKQDWKNARALLDQEIHVNSAQADGMTALHWSVYHDHVEMVQRLLDAGANVNTENRYGVRALSIGCLNGHGEIVELLLKQGADPNHPLRGGETPLMTASRTGKPGPVQALLAHGAKVNAKERRGQTALMWAAAEGNVEAIDLLLKAGADFKTPLKSGFTPLFFAVREGRTDAVFRLLAAGLDLNDTMQIERGSGGGPSAGTSPLILAVENGHLELAAKLLEAGGDPNDKRTGYTPLHAITWVRKPLRGDGDPPPIGSGKVSSLEFVRILVKHGAEINIRHGKHSAGNGQLNKTDATPFLLAAETGDIPLLKLLVELGADPKLTNKDNCTPLLAASGVGVLGNGDESAGTEEEAIAAVKLLLELGADINAIDDRGNSAMHGAAFKSWTKLVQFLADHGADVDVWNTKNKFGWTPLLIAQGHRPGNFRPSAETIVAVESAMRAAGVEPPAAPAAASR
ncbi:MAG TPA: ankyrin repeat domain-containing protein [Planctomycetaceae bacterium]|nr:ankyrin repeat domain-containing protein [Planctomycetaceae bacterium]